MDNECYHLYQYPSKKCLRCGKDMGGDWVTHQATDFIYTIDRYGRVVGVSESSNLRHVPAYSDGTKHE
jgi:hypothetical protein